MSASILIIEDHASVRMLLARMLEDAGYQVFEAATGRQGLEQLRVQLVYLLITDLKMPEINGLEFILELTRAFLDVKVMAISGCSADGLQQAKLPGARQIFRKPFDLRELLHAVQYDLRH